MLNADDEVTPVSLRRLKDVVRSGRPVVVWVGAGASRWANLPSWHDLAKLMRKSFAQRVPAFPNDVALAHIAAQTYPQVFELCRDLDHQLYNSILVNSLNAPTPAPLFAQFIDKLKRLEPIGIVTTNADLCLEQQIGPIDVIETADMERCGTSILTKSPFVGKLHGSVSSIGTMVFTSADYQRLLANSSYIAAVKGIFAVASVVFLGYGLRDEYVLKLLAESQGEHELFGSGPHFLVTEQSGPAEHGVHRISYKTTRHRDHRAALTVLDVIAQAKLEETPSSPRSSTQVKRKSGFYISDFKPSGTHVDGHSIELGGPSGPLPITAIHGLGFVAGELPSSNTVAFHDLAVGLTCFDRVFLPLKTIDLPPFSPPVVTWKVPGFHTTVL